MPMGGRTRRLRLGRQQRARRGEEDQGAGADGTRRAAAQRHRAELLPLLCPVPVAGSPTAVSRGARDVVQRAATRDRTGWCTSSLRLIPFPRKPGTMPVVRKIIAAFSYGQKTHAASHV